MRGPARWCRGARPAALAALLLAGGGPQPRLVAAEPYDHLTDADLERLAVAAAAWVRSERDRLRPRGRPLAAAERRALAEFFPPALLAAARVVRVDGFENPGFFDVLVAGGDPLPLDLRHASALALIDTIAVAGDRAGSRRGWHALLFHELVHLAQYRALGLDRYFERYVGSWARAGFDYRAIAQEAQAYELAARYAARPGAVFSVAREVERRFGAAR